MEYLLKGWYRCPGTGWKVITEKSFQANDKNDAWKVVEKQCTHINERKLFQEVEPTK